ncbi:MAG: hypothetical protein RJA44_767 [Pseudomonadota bacterium]
MRHLVRPAALVASYLDTLGPGKKETARAVQQALLAAAPELEQTVRWGNLIFMLQGRQVLALAAHKAHLSVLVNDGAALAAQLPQLEGAGKGQRHLKLRWGQPPDVALLTELVGLLLAAERGARPD